MAPLVELALLMLVAYAIGGAIGLAIRRAMREAPIGPSAAAAGAPLDEADLPLAEPAAAPGPVPVETTMPARPRRSNIRIVVPPLEIEEPDAPGQDRPRLPFALDAPAGGVADNLKQINGIGPKLESRLNAAGIFHLGQIARLSRKASLQIDEALSLGGRVTREDWAGQAKALVKEAKKRPAPKGQA